MKKEETEKKILDAAFRLISQKGYLGTKTREIAEEAHVAELTIFRHFGSKERLFEGILNTYTFLPKLRGLLIDLEGMSLQKTLMILGINFFESLKERKPLISIMFSELNLYPEKVKLIYNNFINELMQTLAGYFESLKAKAFMRNISHKTAADIFFGMLFSHFLREEIILKHTITHGEMKKIAEQIVDIFLHGTLKH
ncbi:MAG: TetR/AcrR family transcriptional regulator [Candidatus Brocadiaceae bacterium]|nr:TetR/AcrR family transcriptional regulator [Candidatus Brocadiaceae bacterium]